MYTKYIIFYKIYTLTIKRMRAVCVMQFYSGAYLFADKLYVQLGKTYMWRQILQPLLMAAVSLPN